MTTIIYLQRHDRKPRGLGIEINKEESDCLKSGVGAVFPDQLRKRPSQSITKTPATKTMLKQRVISAVQNTGCCLCTLTAVMTLRETSENTSPKKLRSSVKWKEAPNPTEGTHISRLSPTIVVITHKALRASQQFSTSAVELTSIQSF